MSQFVRKNGFTDPLNGYQIVTWTMILITVTITNIVYIPNLSRNRKITRNLSHQNKFYREKSDLVLGSLTSSDNNALRISFSRSLSRSKGLV